jgi:hypothetical protein
MLKHLRMVLHGLDLSLGVFAADNTSPVAPVHIHPDDPGLKLRLIPFQILSMKWVMPIPTV